MKQPVRTDGVPAETRPELVLNTNQERHSYTDPLGNTDITDTEEEK
jgi:hypothetical protein